MTSREHAGLVARPLLLGLPLLIPLLVEPGRLPPGLAYAVTDGRWLFLLGLAAAIASVATAAVGVTFGLPSHLASRLATAWGRLSWPALWLAGAVFFWAVIPGPRWHGTNVGGDEWKYLQMAQSLARDLDVDVGPESEEALVDSARASRRGIRLALGGLLHYTPPDPDHRWSLGSWRVAGRHGGEYYVQSPGLPAILAPAVALQERFLPSREGPLLPHLVLAVLWATALVQTCRLATEWAGSLAAGLVAGAATMLSAPLLVGGYTFYPEAAAAAVVPWALRHARPSGAAPSLVKAGALFLVVGALPWLHPKFTLLSLALTLLLALRLESNRRSLALLAAIPMLGLLLFDHYVTGLFGFDAFYRRYGTDVYPGLGVFLSSRMPIGLVNGLFAARDGLLVMAPVLAAGVLAIPVLWRRDRAGAIRLGLAFMSLWIAAAAHEGGAPGPPGRLLAPVACVLAVPLAWGLRSDITGPAFRWVAAYLAIVSIAILVSILGHWRKEVNPYRGMFRAETDFSRDLPDGRREVGEVTGAVKQRRDVLRGVFLAGILAFWASRFRVSTGTPGPWSTWRTIRDVHLGLWATLAVGAWVLHALGP